MKDLFLVTGASGYVGGEVVRQLRSKGVHVRAMVRHENQRMSLEKIGAEVVIGDLEIPESLDRAVQNVSGVYHIAGLFRQAKFHDSKYFAVNAEGTKLLLDASIKAGVNRFIHCSTIGVHGNVDTPPADEDSALNPGDVYQRSKLEGEKIARSYFSSGKINGVVIRPAMVYGPGDMRTLKLFQMVAKGRFFFVGKGDAFVHFVDVRDLARAFELAMHASEINNEIYIVAGKEALPLRVFVSLLAVNLDVEPPSLCLPVKPMQLLGDACEVICTSLGIEPPIYRRRVDFFTKNRHFNWNKAKSHLGFIPNKDLEEEIVDIIESYRLLGLLPNEPIHEGEFSPSMPSRMLRDINGVIRAWDGGGEKRYGYKREQALGSISHSLLCTEFPEPLERINKTLMRERRWDGILLHTKRDGSSIRVKSKWQLIQPAKKEEPKVIEVNEEGNNQFSKRKAVASLLLGNILPYQPVAEALLCTA